MHADDKAPLSEVDPKLQRGMQAKKGGLYGPANNGRTSSYAALARRPLAAFARLGSTVLAGCDSPSMPKNQSRSWKHRDRAHSFPNLVIFGTITFVSARGCSGQATGAFVLVNGGG